MKSYRELLPRWAGKAACASEGELLEDFFSEETSAGAATGQVLEAKLWCHRGREDKSITLTRVSALGHAVEYHPRIEAPCPVVRECLTWAMQHEEDLETRAGIYGGLTPEERQEIADSADAITEGLNLFDEQATMYLDLRPRRTDGRPRRSSLA